MMHVPFLTLALFSNKFMNKFLHVSPPFIRIFSNTYYLNFLQYKYQFGDKFKLILVHSEKKKKSRDSHI